jgi:hypothetical protein
MQCVQPQGAERHDACSCEGQNDAMHAAVRGRMTQCVWLRVAERRDACSYEGHGNMAHVVTKASNMVRAVGKEHGDCSMCRCKDAVRWGKLASMSSPRVVAVIAIALHSDE